MLPCCSSEEIAEATLYTAGANALIYSPRPLERRRNGRPKTSRSLPMLPILPSACRERGRCLAASYLQSSRENFPCQLLCTSSTKASQVFHYGHRLSMSAQQLLAMPQVTIRFQRSIDPPTTTLYPTLIVLWNSALRYQYQSQNTPGWR